MSRSCRGLRGLLGAGAAALLLATFAAVGASAQSLNDALIQTYLNNPALQAERARLRAVDERVPQALGGWRPRVQMLGSAARVRSSGNLQRTNSTDNRNDYSATFEVRQNLYRGGADTYSLQRAESDVLAARARLEEAEQAVLFNAVTAYMNVLRDTAVVDLNRQNERRLERQLEATQDRFEVGEVTRTDVAQAESRLARARADRIAAEGDLEVGRAFYEQIVGAPPVQLRTPTDLPGIPAGRQNAIAVARDSNPTVRAAVNDWESAKTAVRIAAADLLPSVDLTAAAAKRRQGGRSDQTTEALSLTLDLTVPIYQQGIVTSQVREARQDAARLLEVIDDARRRAVEDATAAWELYQSTLAQIEAREAEVRAASIALDGVEQEAAVGARTVLDVLDAEQELVDAQVNLVRARRDEVVARYDLIVAVGEMTARGLGLDVPGYDASAYYGEVRDKPYDWEAWDEIFAPGLAD